MFAGKWRWFWLGYFVVLPVGWWLAKGWSAAIGAVIGCCIALVFAACLHFRRRCKLLQEINMLEREILLAERARNLRRKKRGLLPVADVLGHRCCQDIERIGDARPR